MSQGRLQGKTKNPSNKPKRNKCEYDIVNVKYTKTGENVLVENIIENKYESRMKIQLTTVRLDK